MKVGLVSFIFSFAILFSNQTIAQVLTKDNIPQESITYQESPIGPTLYGVFEGRPLCQEMASQVNVDMTSACTHLKWRLILYVDPATGKPTTFTSYMGLYGRTPHKGNWSVKKGSPYDKDATLIVLDFDKPAESFTLMKGDDNVLFILDQHNQFRVGDMNFSYTLNRVKLVKGER